MRRISSCIVIVLGLAAACDKKPSGDKAAPAPAPAQAPAAATSPKPEAKPEAAAPDAGDPMAGWTERKGDGFSVHAPQEPKVTTRETNATGTPLPTTMYTHYVPDGAPGALQVMFTQLDAKAKLDAKQMFDAMRDSMLKQFSGKIVKDAAMKLDGATGHEYWLEGEHPRMGKMGVHAKFVLANTRLYLVQSLYAADAKDFAAQGDKFVESFKLL